MLFPPDYQYLNIYIIIIYTSFIIGVLLERSVDKNAPENSLNKYKSYAASLFFTLTILSTAYFIVVPLYL